MMSSTKSSYRSRNFLVSLAISGRVDRTVDSTVTLVTERVIDCIDGWMGECMIEVADLIMAVLEYGCSIIVEFVVIPVTSATS